MNRADGSAAYGRYGHALFGSAHTQVREPFGAHSRMRPGTPMIEYFVRCRLIDFVAATTRGCEVIRGIAMHYHTMSEQAISATHGPHTMTMHRAIP